MKNKFSRSIALGAFVLGLSVTAAAVEFNIPPQALDAALLAFSEQAKVQVSVSTAGVTGIRTEGVAGDFSPEQALASLLRNTGLRFRAIGERTFSVSEGEKIGRTETVGARVAQGEAGVGNDSSSDTTEAKNTAGIGEVEKLEEVVVTGSHIRGIENNTVPVTILDRQYIESTGLSTTAALIESLPQNFARASQGGVLVPGVSSAFVQGSSIDLRGLGEGTTLTLLNGRRIAPGFSGRAADISALPLSAIERVEVLTDGASALYGSDAVGGVVNFVLRKDFDGAETRLRYGNAQGGVSEYRAGQVFGRAWNSGNALLSLEYYKRDLLRASERDFVPSTVVIGSLFPDDENKTVLFSGRQELSDSLALFADALYTQRESFNEAGSIATHTRKEVSNPQLSSNLGLKWNIAGEWQLDASGTHSENNAELRELSDSFTAQGHKAAVSDTRYQIDGAQLKADGPLLDLPGGSLRLAVGTEWRSEAIKTTLTWDQPNGNSLSRGGDIDFDRTVKSAYGELFIPVIGESNSARGIRRLQLSLAGRFDDYSSIDSSLDPKIGFMWEPVQGLRLRGSYGTSYVAPALFDYNLGDNGGLAITLPDPGIPGVPNATSYQLLVFGIDTASLDPQESKNYSFGFDINPSFAPDLKLGLNFYQIKYSKKIERLPTDSSVMLGNLSAYGALITRNPTPAQVSAIVQSQVNNPQGFLALDPVTYSPLSFLNFDPNLVDAIVDQRRRNLAVVKTSGIDLTMEYGFEAAGGRINLGLSGTYILELQKQVTATSAADDVAGTIYNPPDWRLRARVGWQYGPASANAFLNHKDSYVDSRNPAILTSVSSYTTMDASLSYDLSHDAKGFPLTIAISAQNLLDKDPPRTAVRAPLSDLGFDPTNASAMGRILAIELAMRW